MKPHYSEADLLETYYTQPGESLPVMMHLAECGECAARYERLDRKLRESAACDAERPETFWTRQRFAIMRRVGEQRPQRFGHFRVARIAAGAALAFILGGTVVYRAVQTEPAPVTAVATAAAAPAPLLESPQVAHDPWQSDELKDFHSVVEWESWIEPQKGGQS